jgi:hypothetical protein
MHPKLCDDTAVITAVQAYTRKIRNAEKRRYAEDFWGAIYNEAAHGTAIYPDSSAYRLSFMGTQAVQMSIRSLIEQHRTRY